MLAIVKVESWNPRTENIVSVFRYIRFIVYNKFVNVCNGFMFLEYLFCTFLIWVYSLTLFIL